MSIQLQAFLDNLRADPGLRADFEADREAVMTEFDLTESDRQMLRTSAESLLSFNIGQRAPNPGF